jgi:DNA-binding winged helix-turn-helix (wHTH) protein/tetratricopeptide (TPR) repeat protein
MGFAALLAIAQLGDGGSCSGMDAIAPTDGASRIVLAREKTFRIGSVEVRPAAREVIGPAGRERVQPRVMQVLIALVRARGEILTRDDLTESCWDGRIVGEDALSRVMSKLRRVGEGVGQDAWRLETIPKVGYRLTPSGQDPDAAHAVAEPFRTPRVSRRAWAALGAGGAVAMATGATLWLRRPRIPDRARALRQRATDALNSGLPEDNQQARGFLREAVALAPDYAEAWGALAFAYQAALLFTDPPRQPGVKAQAEAAARRALELDPNEPQATATLALLAPVWRNWTTTERLFQRSLALHAHDPLVEHVYARLLAGVGRLKDAVIHGQAAVKGDEFSVWHHHILGLSLWGVGRIEEADQLVARALTRWPRHYVLWFLQLSLFTYSGRADRAVSMGGDLENRPLNIPFADVELSLMGARALMTRAPADIAKALEANLAAAKRGVGYAENAMSLASALGRLDEAFALAGELYLAPGLIGAGQRFSTGRFQMASRRQTHHLFMPPTASMRADRRFQPLMRQIGLVDYWHTSGHPPDAPLAQVGG